MSTPATPLPAHRASRAATVCGLTAIVLSAASLALVLLLPDHPGLVVLMLLLGQLLAPAAAVLAAGLTLRHRLPVPRRSGVVAAALTTAALLLGFTGLLALTASLDPGSALEATATPAVLPLLLLAWIAGGAAIVLLLRQAFSELRPAPARLVLIAVAAFVVPLVAGAAFAAPGGSLIVAIAVLTATRIRHRQRAESATDPTTQKGVRTA